MRAIKIVLAVAVTCLIASGVIIMLNAVDVLTSQLSAIVAIVLAGCGIAILLGFALWSIWTWAFEEEEAG